MYLAVVGTQRAGSVLRDEDALALRYDACRRLADRTYCRVLVPSCGHIRLVLGVHRCPFLGDTTLIVSFF
jgi:hypothetical protein